MSKTTIIKIQCFILVANICASPKPSIGLDELKTDF